ncbi:MAG: TRAP transporter substrate-binding protein [Tropicimonas sp.]|uniref:TRAP transporter substrate-binding protein n=1 Tax=Tropicimonas sp. TaxID=2067044 RepID=UPI003A887045
MKTKAIATFAAASLLACTAANAQQTLRMQTHLGPETLQGKQLQQFADDVARMSGGELTFEIYFSSALVATAETFGAALDGILDCDATNTTSQVGRNPAFQFVGEVIGGYESSWQLYSWLYQGGGEALAQKLYNDNGMTFIGWWIPGPESLVSSKPLAGLSDVTGWKFRSPAGMETQIFANLGATPIVMDFTEVFTSLETGIIDGSDVSNITNNQGMGVYEIAKHTTYPGFHTIPTDQVSCRTDVWEGLSDQHRAIIEVAMQKLALQTTLAFEYQNAQTAREVVDAGVNLYDWSAEDRQVVREASREAWADWAERSPEAKEMVDSHIAYMKQIGLLD